MDDIKFCYRCKHFLKGGPIGMGPGFIESQCDHPNTPVSLVHGRLMASPHDMRKDEGRCGPEGVWHEPKKPGLIARLFRRA